MVSAEGRLGAQREGGNFGRDSSREQASAAGDEGIPFSLARLLEASAACGPLISGFTRSLLSIFDE